MTHSVILLKSTQCFPIAWSLESWFWLSRASHCPCPYLVERSLRLSFYWRWGFLLPAFPSYKNIQMFAQVLCPVQNAFCSDVLSLLWFSFSLNNYHLNLEFDVFSYTERTVATTAKAQLCLSKIFVLWKTWVPYNTVSSLRTRSMWFCFLLAFPTLLSTEEAFSQYLWEWLFRMVRGESTLLLPVTSHG